MSPLLGTANMTDSVCSNKATGKVNTQMLPGTFQNAKDVCWNCRFAELQANHPQFGFFCHSHGKQKDRLNYLSMYVAQFSPHAHMVVIWNSQGPFPHLTHMPNNPWTLIKILGVFSGTDSITDGERSLLPWTNRSCPLVSSQNALQNQVMVNKLLFSGNLVHHDEFNQLSEFQETQGLIRNLKSRDNQILSYWFS